ncbi:MAG: T9SS type A sorting domain-containing protein [Candidatus Delongbacteria bacterium]|jgi:hypothetical protein|nr:T9SS type A sorting domain-containing protein [Candidatus Delongbacteria bacterium]
MSLHQFKYDHKLEYSMSEPDQLGSYYKYFNNSFVFIGNNNHLIGTLGSESTYEELEQMINKTLASYYDIYLINDFDNIILSNPNVAIDLNDIFFIPEGIEPEFTIYSNSDPYIINPEILGRRLILNRTEFTGVSKIFIQIRIPDTDIAFTTSLYAFNSTGNHDDFEYQDIAESSYPWILSSKSWNVSRSEYFTGKSSFASAEIADGDSSSVSISVDVTDHGYMSFAYKTSTEAFFDYLSFSIDGVEMESLESFSTDWAGENDWKTVFYNVRPGLRTFKWTYHKNSSVALGEDKVWIDSIVLPGLSKLTETITYSDTNFDFKNFPNPFNPITKIEFNLNNSQHIKLNVFDIRGRVVQTLFNGLGNKGYNSFDFDGYSLSSGVYYAVLTTPIQQKILKMILMK